MIKLICKTNIDNNIYVFNKKYIFSLLLFIRIFNQSYPSKTDFFTSNVIK